MSYKAWLKSPRFPAELDTTKGGGIVFRQAPHQIEIVRRIGGGLVGSVLAYTGRWAPGLNTGATSPLCWNFRTERRLCWC